MQGVAAQEWGENAVEQGPAALLDTLHCLRVAVTIFDAEARLVFASTHLNHIFRKLPPVQGLIGKFYEELIALELPEIAPAALAGGTDAFIAARLSQLGPRAWEPRDIPLADGRIIEIKARRAPNGKSILLWTDVTAARHQIAPPGRGDPAVGRRLRLLTTRKTAFVTGNQLYAQLAGFTLEELSG